MKNLDLDILKRAQSGDPQAINELILVCRIDVERYAKIHCRVSDFEDAAQESLITLSKSISNLKYAAAFSSWLFTIVKRECHKALRFAYRNLYSKGSEYPDFIREEEATLKYDLAKCLESLPPHYLQIIILRDFEERSISEICEIMGEDASAIKSRLHRARRFIREYFKLESK